MWIYSVDMVVFFNLEIIILDGGYVGNQNFFEDLLAEASVCVCKCV